MKYLECEYYTDENDVSYLVNHYIQYHNNGNIFESEYYNSKGLKNGLWTYYFENGNKMEEDEFNNDRKIGRWEFWQDNELSLMKQIIMDLLWMKKMVSQYFMTSMVSKNTNHFTKMIKTETLRTNRSFAKYFCEINRINNCMSPILLSMLCLVF